MDDNVKHACLRLLAILCQSSDGSRAVLEERTITTMHSFFMLSVQTTNDAPTLSLVVDVIQLLVAACPDAKKKVALHFRTFCIAPCLLQLPASSFHMPIILIILCPSSRLLSASILR